MKWCPIYVYRSFFGRDVLRYINAFFFFFLEEGLKKCAGVYMVNFDDIKLVCIVLADGTQNLEGELETETDL